MIGLEVIPEDQTHNVEGAADGAAPSAAPTGEVVSVRVAVRTRPLLLREKSESAKPCIHVDEVSHMVAVGSGTGGAGRQFFFDHAYGPLSKQDKLYTECVAQLVDSCLQGYNSTVFAYGQTGSGKTFTMGSGDQLGALEEDQGIVPRAVRQLCDGIDSIGETSAGAETFSIRAQLLEIYNEELRDLLADSPDESSKRIAIREGPEGSIVVTGATEHPVQGYDSIMRLFDTAVLARATGSTLMNERSSRSHAIFTLIVEKHIAPTDYRDVAKVYSGKLHLVDLAGSERNKKTGATGARFKESVSINQGLLALGNVIAALTDDRRRGRGGGGLGHVPYRDSKLTRMLQDSLGGNSRTCMIACISPAESSLDETLNTLKYAQRAKAIKNRPTINAQVVAGAMDIYSGGAAPQDWLRREIQGLQLELLKRMVQDPTSVPPPIELYQMLGQEAATVIIEALKARGGAGAGGQGGEDQSINHPDVSAILPSGAPTARDAALRLQELEEARRQLDDLAAQLQRSNTERTVAQARLDRINTSLAKTLLLLEDLEASGALTTDVAGRVRGALEVARRGGEDSGSLAASVGNMPRPSTAVNRVSRARNSGAARPSTASARLMEGGEQVVWDGTAEGGGAPVPAGPSAAQLQAELAVRTERLADLEAQLMEAQDDLARDEVIFAEKTREIRELRQTVSDWEERHRGLISEHESALSDLHHELRRTREDHEARMRHVQQQATAAMAAMAGGRDASLSFPVLEGGQAAGGEQSQSALLEAPHHASRGSPAPHQAHEPHRSTSHPLPEDEDEVVVATEESMMAMGDTHSARRRRDAPAVEPMSPAQAELAVLQEEYENLLVEKQELEARAAQDRHDFLRFQHTMQRQLDDLSQNITMKEDLIRQISDNEAAARELSTQYEARVRELEREAAAREAEAESLRRELEALESDRAKSQEEKRRIRTQYEERVARVQSQLLGLRKQIKEHEAIGTDKEHDKDKAAQRAQTLEQELAKLKQQKDILLKRVRDASETHDKEADRRARELTVLRRDQDGHLKRIRELEEDSRRKERMLRRRDEDLAGAQRRIKELETELMAKGRAVAAAEQAMRLKTPAKGGATPVPEGSERGEGQQAGEAALEEGGGAQGTPAPMNERNAPRGRTPPARKDKEPERRTSKGAGTQRRTSSPGAHDAEGPGSVWIQVHVQNLVRRRDAEARLSTLQERVRGLEQDREALVEQKSRLDLRRIRAAEAARNELEDLEAALVELRDEALGMSHATDISDPRALAELAELDRQKQLWEARREDLSSALASEALLTEEEEAQLRRVEDALDSIEAELEFLTGERDECTRQIRAATQAEAALGERARDLSKAEASTILSKYIEALAHNREVERQQTDKICELEVRLAEADKVLEEARMQAKRVEIDADRRITEVQRQSERKLMHVMGQVEVVARGSRAGALGGSQADGAGDMSARAMNSARSLAQGQAGAQSIEGTFDGLPVGDLQRLVAFYKEQAELLQRDNLYYKNVSRDLKRRIKQELVDVESRERHMSELFMLNESLEVENVSLRQELVSSAMKTRKHGKSRLESSSAAGHPLASSQAYESSSPAPQHRGSAASAAPNISFAGSYAAGMTPGPDPSVSISGLLAAVVSEVAAAPSARTSVADRHTSPQAASVHSRPGTAASSIPQAPSGSDAARTSRSHKPPSRPASSRHSGGAAAHHHEPPAPAPGPDGPGASSRPATATSRAPRDSIGAPSVDASLDRPPSAASRSGRQYSGAPPGTSYNPGPDASGAPSSSRPTTGAGAGGQQAGSQGVININISIPGMGYQGPISVPLNPAEGEGGTGGAGAHQHRTSASGSRSGSKERDRA